MKSMTGFAKEQSTIGGKTVTVEIKTLNSKNLDLNVKIPSTYWSSEIEIRRRLARLLRGKVDVYIREEESTAEGVLLNRDLVIGQYRALKSLSDELGCDSSRLLDTLVSKPDVWKVDDSEQDEAQREQLLQLVERAIDTVEESRQHEGEILERDIMLHVDIIEQRLGEINQYESERITTARERIKKYFEEFAIKEIDTNRFEQEIIYYLEKLDITEEKVRLQKHIDYFRQTAVDEVACGKKLGFIAQEMGREINTTGSKSNHVEMQKLVVMMKDELEKIKEQLGNIL
ncbi:MAG: YicC family protein [Bacteroidales bacterium]|nr:YicC family protein [Bacteroidales bacterium]